MTECKKCSQKYIGTSGPQLKYRLADHQGYVTNQVASTATGVHFNLSGQFTLNIYLCYKQEFF